MRAWLLLAMTQWRRGDQAKARECYLEAVRLTNQHQSPTQLEEADDLGHLVDFWLVHQSPSPNQQLRELRAEAATLLGADGDAQPTRRKEDKPTQQPEP